jgi:hypothetical protein
MDERTEKVAKNLRRFSEALAQHDRENPTHHAWGIGLSYFDLQRLGFEEGEEILPGITVHVDGGVSGNFRILCDGQHDDQGSGVEEAEGQVVLQVVVPAIQRQLPPAED